MSALRRGSETGMAALRLARSSSASPQASEGCAMLDIAYILLALASFALFGLAARGCERL
jgi:hypothetical protein